MKKHKERGREGGEKRRDEDKKKRDEEEWKRREREGGWKREGEIRGKNEGRNGSMVFLEMQRELGNEIKNKKELFVSKVRKDMEIDLEENKKIRNILFN